MKPLHYALLPHTAVEVPLLLWLGIALLLAGLIVAFTGHRPKRDAPSREDLPAGSLPVEGSPDGEDLR